MLKGVKRDVMALKMLWEVWGVLIHFSYIYNKRKEKRDWIT